MVYPEPNKQEAESSTNGEGGVKYSGPLISTAALAFRIPSVYFLIFCPGFEVVQRGAYRMDGY